MEIYEDLVDSDEYCGFTSADIFDMMMLTIHDENDFRLPNNEEITVDNIKEFVAFFVCDNCSANRALSKLDYIHTLEIHNQIDINYIASATCS